MSEAAPPAERTIDRDLLAALDRLESALAEESDALTAGPPERITTAVAAKRRALAALEQIAARPGTRTHIDREAIAMSIVERIRHCWRQNLVAGGAIARARQDNERVLRFLGRTPSVTGYAQDGHARVPTVSRALGTA
jgi:flagellar biosynthesis/type III secretory pathway chaperone